MAARTIDVHAHVLFPQVMGRCGAAGPEMGVRNGVPFFRSGDYVLENVRFVDSPFSSLERRLELMARLRIDHQVLSPNPLTYFYRQSGADGAAFCRANNDAMAAAVAAYPASFSGLAQLPLQDPQRAVDELTRAVETLGLGGSYLGSDIAGRSLTDPAFEPLWHAHERLGVACVVHPAPRDAELAPGETAQMRQWDLDLVVGFASDETTVAAQFIFGGILDRHPGLHLHIPHAGGNTPWLKGRFEMALRKRPWAKNLLQRPFDDLWRQMSFDCLIKPGPNMKMLVEAEGADRVLLGTNFAGWDQDDGIVASVEALPIADADRDAILGGNARRLFRVAA
jgi:aminocarboxymuconate-semialdehyde decarboxylase